MSVRLQILVYATRASTWSIGGITVHLTRTLSSQNGKEVTLARGDEIMN